MGDCAPRERAASVGRCCGPIVLTETDWLKAFVALATTAAGVLVGLLGNSVLKWTMDKRTYASMLRAFHNEAINNKFILQKSFFPFFKYGLVLRQFSITTSSNCLADPIFVKCAKPGQLPVIYEYLRNLALANFYREKNEELLLRTDTDVMKGWIVGLSNVWADNLKDCARSIEQITAVSSI